MKNARQKSPPAKPAAKAKPGRPSGYSPERVGPFLDAIAEAKSTREAAALIGVTKATVFDWLAKHKDFSDRYARAKEAAADFIVEEILAIADDASNDWMETNHGPVLNAEAVARSRLRIDARKWLAGKLRPKKYGDRIDVDHGVQSDNPLGELLRRVQGNAMPIRDEQAEA